MRTATPLGVASIIRPPEVCDCGVHGRLLALSGEDRLQSREVGRPRRDEVEAKGSRREQVAARRIAGHRPGAAPPVWWWRWPIDVPSWDVRRRSRRCGRRHAFLCSPWLLDCLRIARRAECGSTRRANLLASLLLSSGGEMYRVNGSREGPSHKRRATQILCSRVATRRANLLGPKAHPRHVTVNVSFANQGNRDPP